MQESRKQFMKRLLKVCVFSTGLQFHAQQFPGARKFTTLHCYSTVALQDGDGGSAPIDRMTLSLSFNVFA